MLYSLLKRGGVQQGSRAFTPTVLLRRFVGVEEGWPNPFVTVLGDD